MKQNTTIHIVDDDHSVAEIVARIVKPIGALVKIFFDADEFLKSYTREGPACLVLDIRIPGMSGLEIQRRLTQSGDTMPIIIVTGNADVKMAVDTMRAGAFNFFEKPFRSQELYDEVQRAVRRDEEVWRQREESERLEPRLALLKSGEREVIDMVIEGRTNNEIALKLDMSIRGVEARRAKAMTKLGVESRAELLELLQKHDHYKDHTTDQENK